MRPDCVVNTTLAIMVSTMLAVPALATEQLGDCEDEQFGPDAKCGFMTVFEDRAAGKGRTIDLEIVILPATGSDAREPLFLLAGGPGQGATDLAPLALQAFSTVREDRDMVLVDQRGTGGSGLIDCPVDAAESPADVFGDLFDPAAIAACLEKAKQHADPTMYTSDLVVDDLDDIRQRLGYDKVFLWGGSGGTRTALVWMRRHPDRVVGAVLDGVAPTDFRAPSTMARGCQDALDAVFAECRQQKDCHTAYPDLEAEFNKLMGLFDEGPVATHIVDQQETRIPVEMHRGDFTYAVRGVLYRAGSLATLPGMIHKAAGTGDIHPFAQAYWQRQVGIRSFVAMGVHFGIYCAEDLPFITEGDVAGFTDGTFVGRYLYDQYKGACDAWEARPVDESFLLPVRSEVPVLIISGYYDPSTPISMGEQVASHLPNSRHVMVRDESHGAEFGCARPAVIEFLSTGSLDSLGPICEDVGPVQYLVGAGT